MMDFSYLRVEKCNETGLETVQLMVNNEWLCCHNESVDEDTEDVRQYHSVLPNFRNQLLKQFNL